MRFVATRDGKDDTTMATLTNGNISYITTYVVYENDRWGQE